MNREPKESPASPPAPPDSHSAPQPLPEATTDVHDAREFSKGRRPSLQVLGGPDTGKRFRLKQGDNVLGRGRHGFSDKEISREHARIVLGGTDATIEDLGSTNGTIIGIDKIEAVRPLQLGQTFYLGTRTLVLFAYAAEEGS